MKKLMIMAVAVMAMATSYAATTWDWAYLDTKGANNETESQINNYSAYYCTAEDAASIFGGASTQEAITDYLAANYVDYSQGIAGMTAMIPYGDGFDQGVYTFAPQIQGGSTSGSHIAIVAYLGEGGDKFRVFESAVDENERSLLFNPDEPEYGGGTAGDWTTAAIPEPTTGVLMLFGLACLALRRRA